MEGLPFDSNADSDATNGLIDRRDEDKKDKAKDKKRSKDKNREIGKDLVDLITNKDEPETKKPEQESKPIDADKTPELDTEAPVEHLSEVEVVAINQALAGEMLKNVPRSDSSERPTEPEDLAAEIFLENVELSGNVDQAFNQAAQEMGIEPDVVEVLLADNVDNMEADPDESAQQQAGPMLPSQPVIINQRPAGNNFNNANTFPTPPTSPDQQTSSSSSTYREFSPAGTGLVLGNIVSYLVGRRRGRINSEKKVLPVQRRLEKEVVELKQDLEIKQNVIKQLAVKNARLFETGPPKVLDVPEAKPKQTAEAKDSSPKSQLPLERIGKVLVTAEAPAERPQKVVDITNEETLRDNKQESERDDPEQVKQKAQNMNRAELLAVAQKIEIDGTTLRQIYEAHLLGEKGLRRVIAVYLRGGNVKRSLKRELVEREIDFERDPSLRDQVAGNLSAPSTKINNLDAMLHRSGIDWTEPSAAIIIPKLDSPKTDAKLDIRSTSQSSTARRIADILMVGVILILAAIIVALILNR